ncbi:hypothetical protein AB0M43_28645 [Longispora sp. NPDC051575]|uniref:hypothetical protein n=1 Tax=Longispora sp. NPDC051575 TaxID=3154943 RepID=UPI003438A791
MEDIPGLGVIPRPDKHQRFGLASHYEKNHRQVCRWFLFGTSADGPLFVGERNGTELPTGTILREWRRARREVFVGEVAAGPLAAVPYDLRHAAISTWLNGGVPPTDAAEWAGQSVEILYRIYAKCLDGGIGLLRQRVDSALGWA